MFWLRFGYPSFTILKVISSCHDPSLGFLLINMAIFSNFSDQFMPKAFGLVMLMNFLAIAISVVYFLPTDNKCEG